MNISLRKFCEEDIPLKVKWINDPKNNTYLHYALPLEEEATKKWWKNAKYVETRLDMTILADMLPVGILGLLNIDQNQKEAELYITVGEQSCKGMGIAGNAMEQLLRIAFKSMDLQRIYLYTETENMAAVRAYEKFGMTCNRVLRENICNREGILVDRYLFSISKEEFEKRYESI